MYREKLDRVLSFPIFSNYFTIVWPCHSQIFKSKTVKCLQLKNETKPVSKTLRIVMHWHTSIKGHGLGCRRSSRSISLFSGGLLGEPLATRSGHEPVTTRRTCCSTNATLSVSILWLDYSTMLPRRLATSLSSSSTFIIPNNRWRSQSFLATFSSRLLWMRETTRWKWILIHHQSSLVLEKTICLASSCLVWCQAHFTLSLIFGVTCSLCLSVSTSTVE